MPRPGDQYQSANVTNPFTERVVNQFTAQEIATLQSRLNKQLGPEYISQRPGNTGGKVAYLEGNKAIALANEVFGFNGWSSSLGQVQIDYVEENPQNGKVSLGLSIVVRITLKDGTYHEDIGYGSVENGRGKAWSFEKAKKEAATDGLKRSLRTFGNVLGNCLYDKEYLKKVQSMKVKPVKFEERKLHRHPDFAPPPVQNEQVVVKQEPQKTPVRTNSNFGSFSAEFDDEYDGNLFDGVELQDDEFTFSAVSGREVMPKVVEAIKSENAPNGGQPRQTASAQNSGPQHPPNPRIQSAPGQNGVQVPGRPAQNAPNRAPHPLQEANRARMDPPTGDIHAVPRPQGQHQQTTHNQPLRPSAPQAQQSKSTPPGTTAAAMNPTVTPNNRPAMGFVTSRAATLMQGAGTPSSLDHIPAFNPHAESPVPKEQRTPGLDHSRSVPIKRQEGGNSAAAQQPPPNSRPVGSAGMGLGRPNFVNPQADTTRRIGMPGGHSMSPGMNKGAYKPPGFVNGGAAASGGLKRERVALQDLSNQTANGAAGQGEGPDAKKLKVEPSVGENAGPAVAST